MSPEKEKIVEKDNAVDALRSNNQNINLTKPKAQIKEQTNKLDKKFIKIDNPENENQLISVNVTKQQDKKGDEFDFDN